jgi:hypothetical protein
MRANFATFKPKGQVPHVDRYRLEVTSFYGSKGPNAGAAAQMTLALPIESDFGQNSQAELSAFGLHPRQHFISPMLCDSRESSPPAAFSALAGGQGVRGV